MNRKLFDSLNEKRQRLYLGELAAEYGASRERVSKGRREYTAGESYRQGEAVRRAGGGRKKKAEIYPNLKKRIVELDGTYGALTDERKRKLSRILKEEGMDVPAGAVASILKKNRLDTLMTRAYEDKVLGGLNEERHRKMTDGHEAEQEALKVEADALEKLLEDREEMSHNLDRFIALTRKYADIPELTPTIVNEFIKKIVVYEHSGVARSRTQEIRIVFNFLDETEYPAQENEEIATKAIETAQNTVIIGYGRK